MGTAATTQRNPSTKKRVHSEMSDEKASGEPMAAAVAASPPPEASIHQDLEQVEHSLNRAESLGRAVFESLGTALGSIRSRLQETSHDMATTISNRLQAAERAHASRIPLNLLQEELERREGETNTTTSTREANLKTDEEEKDDEREEKQRQASTLMASRRVAEAATDHSAQVDLHEGASGGLVLPFAEAPEPQDDASQEPNITALLSNEDDNNDDDDDNNETRPTSPTRLSRSANLSGSLSFSSSKKRVSSSLSMASTSSTTSSHKPLPPAVVYSWGVGPHSLHEDAKDRPRELAPLDATSRVGRSFLVSVATSVSHSACATATGQVLVCGDNSHGAVDPLEEPMTIPKPRLLELMSMTRILQVSCGLDHTAALTESRSVLTWGSNVDGQLGHRTVGDQPRICQPAAMILGAGRRAASVACGHRFTLVLTSRMEVVMCGREEITGYSTVDGPPRLPAQNPALEALPLVAMAAGSHHAVVITAHGTAYAWGVNNSGCCGREFPPTITVPVPMLVPATSCSKLDDAEESPFLNWAVWKDSEGAVTLADDVSVVQAACGDEHTILVTKTGRLLVCGSNSHKQLGLESKAAVCRVEPVTHPTNGKFVAAAAGTSHSLLLDDKGDVWQTGNDKAVEICLREKSIVMIAAGGGQNVAIAAGPGLDLSASNLGISFGQKLATGLEELIEGIVKDSSRNDDVGDSAKELASRVEELFRHSSVVNSFVLNPPEVDSLYGRVVGTGNLKERQQVVNALEKGMSRGLDAIRTARLLYPESMRCLLIYLQCPLFREDASKDIVFDVTGDLIQCLCETILGLPFEGYKAFLTWATALYSKKYFSSFLVQPLMFQLDKRLARDRTRAVPVIVGVLRWLQNASERAGNLASPEVFHSQGVGGMPLEALFEDLQRFKAASKPERAVNFYICANSFLLSPSTKRNLLQVENQVAMVRAAQVGSVQFDLIRREFRFNPYFVLPIDRQFMLQQTLHAVAAAPPNELRKSLKIVFKGEDGVDAGGVKKEFFQLLSAQLFDLNTGMWSMQLYELDAHHTWFNSDCTWNYDGYYLVGVLVGLAVYNSVILDVHFPSSVYRKLLGLPLGLEDMIDDDVRKGLQHLLEYDNDDVEDIFCLTFEITWMDLGVERRKELKPGGASVSVTQDNKEEYVMLYVKWLLVDSVHSQYREFERGFMRVMDTSCLSLLHPEELELLVVGTPELDFDALEKNTEYEGGYDANTPVIKNFWKFIKNAPQETKLRFLKFTTGSSKAPIGGLAETPFKIQRAGADSMQLPTAHTCFNTLLIPDYGDDYDKLAERVGRAVLECEGFGLQ